MKCLACGNTEKFFIPIIGYQTDIYKDNQLENSTYAHTERDLDRDIQCAFCEGQVEEKVND